MTEEQKEIRLLGVSHETVKQAISVKENGLKPSGTFKGIVNMIKENQEIPPNNENLAKELFGYVATQQYNQRQLTNFMNFIHTQFALKGLNIANYDIRKSDKGNFIWVLTMVTIDEVVYQAGGNQKPKLDLIV